MTVPRLFTPFLLGLVLLGGLVSRPAGRVAAQIPDPSPVLTTFVGASTDAQGIVVTWNVAIYALNSDYYAIYRRSGLAPAGSGAQIAVVAGVLRGYTDYTVPGPGIWCYQVVAVAQSRLAFASTESCAGFLPGVPGDKSPAFGAGCSQFFQSQPSGTPMAAIAARFDPPAAVVSLWRFDATQQRLVAGYFTGASVPADFSSLPATFEFEFACLAAPATYRSS